MGAAMRRAAARPRYALPAVAPLQQRSSAKCASLEAHTWYLARGKKPRAGCGKSGSRVASGHDAWNSTGISNRRAKMQREPIIVYKRS